MFDLLVFCGFFIPITMAQCPPNTFRCLDDSSCIPYDWVGDGEPDCLDSSDERNASLVQSNGLLKQPTPAIVSHPITTAATTTININDSKIVVGTEDSFDDPFDQIVTIASPHAITLKNMFSTEKSDGQVQRSSVSRQPGICSSAVQFRINECSEDLTTWLRSIEHIDLVNGSILTEERR